MILLIFSQPFGCGFSMLFRTQPIGFNFISEGGRGLLNDVLRINLPKKTIFSSLFRVEDPLTGTIWLRSLHIYVNSLALLE